ncbi:hypothetical protein CANARDRAFT_5735 [[Candida] arabinofermentans NRRL YB-2248]|uniref:TRP C-terminal domain-containing protein n=1 Tax=[Candida] arabinofermentans NRRL YB-2248 TaxID=983967 RepID=A0A1E4T638_9ASCO|nr:hypothetical protein CANARDRAFT_5735 [[Candida] arabinofermentans NRRL YB-2248]
MNHQTNFITLNHDHDSNNDSQENYFDQNSVNELANLQRPVSSMLSHEQSQNNDAQSEVYSTIFDLNEQAYVERLFKEGFKPHQKDKSIIRKFSDNVWKNGNAWNKIFLINSVISAVVILALEALIFAVYIQNMKSNVWNRAKYNAVAVYLALYIYAEIYQVVFTLIALSTSNVYHLYSAVLFLGAMAVYSGIQLHELDETLLSGLSGRFTRHTIQALSITVTVCSCVACVVQLIVSKMLFHKFKQATGEKVGNNFKLIQANMAFNLHRDCVILGYFFFPAFTLQFIVILVKKSDPEFTITVVVLALTFVILVLADYSATRELVIGMVLTIVCYLAGIAYLVFKLYRLTSGFYHSPGKRSLIAFDVFSLILIAVLIVISLIVTNNFGKGMKKINKNNYTFGSSKSHTFESDTESKLNMVPTDVSPTSPKPEVLDF